jgi:hypothetical protein
VCEVPAEAYDLEGSPMVATMAWADIQEVWQDTDKMVEDSEQEM